jgi:hypothetical protein
MSERVIVSRHPAAIEFIAQCLSTEGVEYVYEHRHPADVRPLGWQGDVIGYVRADVDQSFGSPGALVDRIPVVASALADEVRGKIVFGNLPMHLATLAREIHVVEFAGQPPRGQEYSTADMVAAGARIVPYVVDRR